jgi:eukaryotic-like serine/threonine-protein kinase
MLPLTAAHPEHRIVGRYVLHGVIASGGMATVHYGRLQGEGGFSRTVAVKCLHPQFASDPDFRAMFLDEARVCARIRHPNVVPILDVVGLEGELFMVMDYVAGESLSRLVRSARRSNERPPPQIVASIMIGVLEGLHAAHEAVSERGEPLGIVHRDVSPQNVMVGTDGVARVVDFGVAKAAGRLQTTRDGQLKGKLSYMAPEQLRSQAVDRRTDVYAASVVMWEALTGRRLFEAEHEFGIFGQVLEGQVDPPSRHVPEVGAALDAIVMRGLARDPADRCPSALEMALAIESAMTPAPARQVGRWVEQMARGALELRAQKVAEIESVSSVSISDLRDQAPSHPSWPAPPDRAPWPSSPSAAPPPGLPDGSGPHNALSSGPHAVDPRFASQATALAMSEMGTGAGSGARPASHGALVAAVAVASTLAVALVVATFALLSKPGPRAGDDAAPPAPAGEQPAAGPVELAPDMPVPLAAEDAAPAVPDPVELEAPPTEPPRRASPAAKRPAAAQSPRPAPRGDCNPAYTLDAKGTRIPKLHCL